MDAANPITISGPHTGQSAACEPILRALPEWFGIEEAVVEYVRNVADLPTFVARRNGDGEVIGFLSIKQHSPQAAEMYVLGVKPEHRRSGIGRMLVDAAEVWLRERGVRFLQVKTLSPSRPCEFYDQTRRFYETLGFVWLEELPTLWDERNPCLVMVKSISLPEV